ncbi:helix-turn-helix domain-containing protein [Spirosoma endbachense]|uniref:Helix-turn-helix domain-containing protein n=1 Tax=Spirosoma endbachense TaxID=2666025 RepID=A0A6P1W8M9_9BACT|nr:helix-turn-helix domain-containing protein [Spirosoma endbachense]QHW00398.1 helix-turn-helix domain-containing protein [Spirosoma endbachense]
MNQPPIPIIDPDTFVDQFVDEDARQQARHPHSWSDSHFPANRFFTLMRIEDFARRIAFPIPTNRSFHYDFMLLTRGSIQRTYGLESYTIGPGMFSVYRAGDIVSTDSCMADATGFYGLFDAEYVLATLKNPHALAELSFLQSDASPVLSLDPVILSDLLAQLARIERALLSQRTDSQAYISSLFYAFLLDVQQQYGHRKQTRQLTSSALLTAHFRHLLTRHILSNRTVNEYADLLAVTPNHLNKCIKEATGKPASVLIAEMLLLEAKVLLGQPGLSISEIAYRLSFDDLSYFARFFKKHTCLNPTQYRQQA